MVSVTVVILVLGAAMVSGKKTMVMSILETQKKMFAYPSDPIIGRFSEGIRYDYLEDDAAQANLVDNWLKISDYDRVVSYTPDDSNEYHLFTRANPSNSQVLKVNNASSVTSSNFDARRRTVVIMHGFSGSASSPVNTVLWPAFLAAGDVNVIVLDWSAGAGWGTRSNAAGEAAGRFINWLNGLTGASPANYVLCGFDVGGHGVGSMARTVNGSIGFVIALDPADRWDKNLVLRPSDASYTEVIHTNAGDSGWLNPLGHVDFYPNGGMKMPGCLNAMCHQKRAYHYYAESLRSGGFKGRRCENLNDALLSTCHARGSLMMGGLLPKPGKSGIYNLKTNAGPPFSRRHIKQNSTNKYLKKTPIFIKIN